MNFGVSIQIDFLKMLAHTKINKIILIELKIIISFIQDIITNYQV
jgi:hypothetical protein